MDLPRQAGLLLVAAEYLPLTREEIVTWADRKIAACPEPPPWLIELSTLGSERLEDYYSLLRQTSRPAPIDPEAMVAMALDATLLGRRDEEETLAALFRLWVGRGQGTTTELPGELLDLVVEWDCHPNYPALTAEFRERCKETFRSWRQEHAAVTNPLAETCPAEPPRGA